jgi:hypothetical protein
VSRLRDAAAQLIAHGRLLGAIERNQAIMRELDALLLKCRLPDAPPIEELIGGLRCFLESEVTFWTPTLAERTAEVEQLITSLEHPGARLARRLVAAARGARAAWRAAR